MTAQRLSFSTVVDSTRERVSGWLGRGWAQRC